MPDDGSTQDSTESTTQFRFDVKWGSAVMHFQEVSGLDLEAQPIDYRHGDSPNFAAIKMPGLKKFGSVTCKKGVLPNATAFNELYNQIKTNTISRTSITITLMDSGTPTMTWTLSNAWPVKVSHTNLMSDDNVVAIEFIEIAHEGLTITNG